MHHALVGQKGITMTFSGKPFARIILAGNFDFQDQDGHSIKIVEKKGRALLAALAMGQDMRRSRVWLKDLLWSRTTNPQNAYSLRQTLFKLHAVIDPYCDVIRANREYIWLENVERVLERPGYGPAEFFEDAPVNDKAFRSWLTLEREAFALSQDKKPLDGLSTGKEQWVKPISVRSKSSVISLDQRRAS